MPPKIEIVSLPDHKSVRMLVDNAALAEKVAPIVAKSPVEFVKVNVGGGVTLDGYVLKPPSFDPRASTRCSSTSTGNPRARP